MTKLTWLITGASSGLGLALAEYVLARGHRVVLAARSPEPMQAFEGRYPETSYTLHLDISDLAKIGGTAQAAETRFGGIDVLVNNAASTFWARSRSSRSPDIRQLLEINFFGPIALTCALLPAMRARKSGIIVSMSSMDGVVAMAANGYYSASKFALEGESETLWQEVEPLGLRVLLVEPSSFLTGIEARTHFSGELITDYAATSGVFRQQMQKVGPEMSPATRPWPRPLSSRSSRPKQMRTGLFWEATPTI